jgi:hypothetical protein
VDAVLLDAFGAGNDLIQLLTHHVLGQPTCLFLYFVGVQAAVLRFLFRLWKGRPEWATAQVRHY